MGLFLIRAKDSATKFKRGQLNVLLCMVYFFPPVPEICARLAGNYCQ